METAQPSSPNQQGVDPARPEVDPVLRCLSERVVRQPNGKFAIFSNLIDQFSFMHGTEEEVYAYFVPYLGEEEARMRVRRGVEDYEPMLGKAGPQGLTRWKDSLNLIEEVYGRMSRLEVEMDGRAHEAPFGPAPELDVDEDLLQTWVAARDREEKL